MNCDKHDHVDPIDFTDYCPECEATLDESEIYTYEIDGNRRYTMNEVLHVITAERDGIFGTEREQYAYEPNGKSRELALASVADFLGITY